MESYRYAYLIGSLMFGAVWLYIYRKRPDLRKEQLFMSFAICILGLSEHLFFGEYWKPQFIVAIPAINAGIESLLLSFFYGGIASTLYEFVFNDVLKIYSRESQKQRTLEIAVSILFGGVVFLLSWSTLSINIIYATSIALISVGAFLVYFRKDLLLPALVNGVIMALLSLFILWLFGLLFDGVFDAWWQIDLLTGYRIFNVPFEEILWHFSLGFAVGPMYEVWKGFSDYASKKKYKRGYRKAAIK